MNMIFQYGPKWHTDLLKIRGLANNLFPFCCFLEGSSLFTLLHNFQLSRCLSDTL